jgi:hypothetical protein
MGGYDGFDGWQLRRLGSANILPFLFFIFHFYQP